MEDALNFVVNFVKQYSHSENSEHLLRAVNDDLGTRIDE